VPASVSLSIPVIAEQVGQLNIADSAWLAPGLRTALAGVPDPRKPRGVRHRLVTVLVVAVCAVAAGARSFVAVAEWVADLPGELAETLDVATRCPSESTIRRVLGRLDADRFDAVIGRFVQHLCTGASPHGRRRVLAVDGKTRVAPGAPTSPAGTYSG
jgi:DDE_Tnp_1-associated